MVTINQQKLIVWTVLGMTMLASLSAIHQSFNLATTTNHPWRNLDVHKALMDNSNSNMLRNRVHQLRDENEALKGKLAKKNGSETVSLASASKERLRRQAEEIERLKKSLEEAKHDALAAKKASLGVNHSATSLGTSLRILWEQLVLETPPGKTNQKVLLNLKKRDPSPRLSNDIVLVTHGSLFKLNTFLTQLGYWNGPASVALYMNSLRDSTGNGIDLLETFLKDNEKRLQNTTIHLLMEYTALESSSTKSKTPGYPHNPLRNLAMEHSGSDYIVALDVDFIPGPSNCYSRMISTLTANNFSLANEMRKKKRIMVLPAFEVYAPVSRTVATADQLPATKEELWESVKSNRSETFRVNRYPVGHNATQFEKWFAPIVDPHSEHTNSKEPFYPIQYRPGFEPYVLAYRPGIPRYWNTYRGFGQNKISWFMELHRAGYTFGALWDYFVIHLEHPTTVNWQERHENIVLHADFLKYLDEKYPLVRNRIPANKGFFYRFKNKPLQKKVSSNRAATSGENRAPVAPNTSSRQRGAGESERLSQRVRTDEERDRKIVSEASEGENPGLSKEKTNLAEERVQPAQDAERHIADEKEETTDSQEAMETDNSR